MSDDYVVGIDLGTTNSCASIFINGRLKILENVEGRRVTPSCVFFTDISNDKVVVGNLAKKMMENNPEYGICGIKRLMGRDFKDPIVQKQLHYLPFSVEEASSGNITISIEQNKTTLSKSPGDISETILRKIKSDISRKLGCSITKAVITVPSYFNSRQRSETLEAAKKAEFNVLKLLNEPTAAALSYFHEKDENNDVQNEYFLVYDLGGGTFDIAIMKRTNDEIETIAVDGDNHLGGRDFDTLLFDHVSKRLMKEFKYDLKMESDKKIFRRKMRRLLTLCEEAKEYLSTMEETTIILEGFVKGEEIVHINIKRDEFEDTINNLLQKTIDIVDVCLKSTNIKQEQIMNVILAGGSTRIPKIQKIIADYFDGKRVEMFTNPDECVAEGAAIQAASLSTNCKQAIPNIKIKDVIPLSLSADNFVHKTRFIIKRGASIPAHGEITFCTFHNHQGGMTIYIFEGERTDSRKNRTIGMLEISNLTPAPPGKCEVIVILNLDHNGILTMAAIEKYCENVKELAIAYKRGQRCDEEIKNSLKDAEDNKDEDEAFVEFATKKAWLLKLCSRCMYNLKVKNLIETHINVYALCKNTSKKAKKFEIDDQPEMERFIRELEDAVDPLTEKYAFCYMPPKLTE